MGNETYPLTQVVSLGLKIVADEGDFVSSSNANQRGIFSTAHLVKQSLVTNPGYKMTGIGNPYEVMEYVKNLTPPTDVTRTGRDYYDRLKEVYQKDDVTYKEVAMVVSALAFFNNPKMSSNDYQDLIGNSKYIGELKKRDNFFVKLLNETFLRKQNCFVYKFITRDGDLGFFFKGKALDITSGDCFLFKGTPIEHSVSSYDKVPTTKFNRVAFLENHGKSNSTDAK